MPDQTPRLELPLLMPSQAQKHVTHNEAIDLLDGLVHLAIQQFDLDLPPETAIEGTVWHIGPAPTGLWIGQAGKLARWRNGGWVFMTPGEGWICWGLTEGRARVCLSGAFVDLPANLPALIQNLAQLGVHTSADTTNRLAVSAAATLLTHDGQGHQLKVNKASATDTASLLFQTGWSGRAEMGLAGSDAFSVKVSDDGAGFVTAMEMPASGRVKLPVGLSLGAQPGDPTTPANGWLWYSEATGGFRGHRRGVTIGIDGGRSFWLTPPSGEYVLSTMYGGTTTSTTAGAAGRMDLFPFVPGSDLNLDQLAVNVTTAVAAALGKIVVYTADAAGWPDVRLFESADLDFSTVGLRSASASLSLWQGVPVWLGVRYSSTATISAWGHASTPDINGGSPVTAARKTVRRTVNFGTAAPASWGFQASEITSGAAPAIWLRRV